MFRSLISSLINFFYPSFCYHCGICVDQGKALCENCLQTIKPTVSLKLPVNKYYSLTVFAASLYQDPLKIFITRKFTKDLAASDHLAHYITQFTPLQTINIDYLIPIPLHWTRYASRGFNQSKRIAHVLSCKTTKPVLNALRRCKKTQFQSRLSTQDRTNNVRNAFVLSWHFHHLSKINLEGKHLVLVDDLCTTGATLVSAARILAEFKPASLTAIVACRTG